MTDEPGDEMTSEPMPGLRSQFQRQQPAHSPDRHDAPQEMVNQAANTTTFTARALATVDDATIVTRDQTSTQFWRVYDWHATREEFEVQLLCSVKWREVVKLDGQFFSGRLIPAHPDNDIVDWCRGVEATLVPYYNQRFSATVAVCGYGKEYVDIPAMTSYEAARAWCERLLLTYYLAQLAEREVMSSDAT